MFRREDYRLSKFAWTKAESGCRLVGSGMDICEQRGGGFGNLLTVICNGDQRICLIKVFKEEMGLCLPTIQSLEVEESR